MTDTSAPAQLTSTSTPPGMTITVRTGTGSGPTHLAAFDAALRVAGVADRNLVRLSSIIPPGATIEVTPDPPPCPGGWGDRLYVVLAEERIERPHEEAWAGIAWCQDLDTGQGLFVEHEGHSKHQVEADLVSSIEAISVARPGHRWSEPHLAITGVTCENEPVCALAVACYQADPWRPSAIDVRDR